ncbi:MAG: Fic family protein [Chlamydiia bacterium]|nr:Fic family protein [Chlamydiia bacterium]
MTKKSLDQLPEVFVSDKTITHLVHRELGRGRLRKLASRLYTKNLTDSPVALIKRHLWLLVGSYFPNGLISDRTALENAPASDGSIFLISSKKRSVTLPGITICPRQGCAPLESDKPFINGLRLSSTARAFLENMVPSRATKGKCPRTLSRKEIEIRLEKLLQQGGEEALKRLRDEMREISPKLKREREFSRLDSLIGTLLGTQEVDLESDLARSRKKGIPYDSKRLDYFSLLFTELKQYSPLLRPEQPVGREICAFYEAYFSNFIEGTEFAVDEAKEIIFEGKIPRDRPQDAHDIIGTFRLVSDETEMHKTPSTFDQLLTLLKSRHATIMGQRPNKHPGQLKTQENRAGTTVFVSPDLVLGTLKKGYEFYQALDEPFQRAVYIMYLISEVHPFTDGNGRLGRVMMNAELVAAGETRLIIPTIFRNNYMVALKAIAQANRASPLIRTLDFSQKYTHSIDWSSLESAQKYLETTNAFFDPNDADLRGIRLILPPPEGIS